MYSTILLVAGGLLCCCSGQPSAPALAPFPTDVNGAFFSGVFSDHAVLQRAPQKSAVYGVVIGAKPTTKVVVKIAGSDSYTLNADVTFRHSGYAWWKANLKAHSAGGNYSVNVACSDCIAPSNSSTITDVTFGDIWFCSGQSNMELPMNHDSSRNMTYDAVLAGRYSSIRLFEMGKNEQPDASNNNSNHDFYIVPPAQLDDWNPDLQDGVISGWQHPTAGRYADALCRIGGGPAPKDPHTPCPDCCSRSVCSRFLLFSLFSLLFFSLFFFLFLSFLSSSFFSRIFILS